MKNKPSVRVGLVGNHTPRRCGIATFTADLSRALTREGCRCEVLAMEDGQRHEYPPIVSRTIEADDPSDYAGAARHLNSACDIACLQHEFGIYGGAAGSHVLHLVENLEVPLVTTLHTVLARPDADQRKVMEVLLTRSTRTVVMGARGVKILRDVYGADPDRIALVPHGVPDLEPEPPARAKRELGLEGRTVLLTFGLLGPGKGLETVVQALPTVVRGCPDLLYVVVGATHPNEKAANGEAYRESLAALADELGLAPHVRFVDEFVSTRDLVAYLRAADIYVTPYPHLEQITSGTLAMAVGLGKAVVSTPYWHAQELLADGCGVLFPPKDVKALASELASLLADPERHERLRRKAARVGRTMRWPIVARSYRNLFAEAMHRMPAPRSQLFLLPIVTPLGRSESVRTDHLEAMTDDVGVLQHARYNIPCRDEGYCTDDNARALLAGLQLGIPGDRWVRLGLAFLSHAWNPARGRFRNFMSYDRRWLEEVGSDDAHGRALIALGAASSIARDTGARSLAGELFDSALPYLEHSTSLRTWAFGLIGIESAFTSHNGRCEAVRLGQVLAERLLRAYGECADYEWRWFEDVLTYDNARIPQALLSAYRVFGDELLLETGLEALDWLCSRQTTAQGLFCPIGSNGFAKRDGPRAWFDQQPIEALASIDATLDALELTHDPKWQREAERAYAWFFGTNLLGTPLADAKTGGCRDGLHERRVNENMGAESTLSFVMAALRMRSLAGEPAEFPRDAGTTA